MNDFNEIYRLNKDRIFKYLIILTGDKYEAEELLQETFFRAFKNIHTFKAKSTVSTWLHSIARNVYLTERSKKKESVPLELVEFKIDGNSMVDNFEKRELLEGLSKAISSLDEHSKQVITMRIYNELSFKEIAKILNKKEVWTRVIFYRGKDKLRKELEKWKK